MAKTTASVPTSLDVCRKYHWLGTISACAVPILMSVFSGFSEPTTSPGLYCAMALMQHNITSVRKEVNFFIND